MVFPKANILEMLAYRILVLLLICALSGCGSELPSFPAYMRPELLYLKPQPYSRLYVEVDTVEGVEVADQWLDELKAFLSRRCGKPDGVEIVRDQPTPMAEIENMPYSLASLLCIDGPRPAGGDQPAYLHVFFYKGGKETHSHVHYLCPSGIFLNFGELGISKGKVEVFLIKHETGHILGLCKNTVHCDGSHCRNQGCLMFKCPDILSTLGTLAGIPVDCHLCARCRNDIEVSKSEDRDPNLLFWGPFLVRREDGYSVASLPYCDFLLSTQEEITLEWQDVLSDTKKGLDETHRQASDDGAKRERKRWYCSAIYRRTSRNVLDENGLDEFTILTRATNDPSPRIRNFAIDQLKKAKRKEKSQ